MVDDDKRIGLSYPKDKFYGNKWPYLLNNE